MCGAVCMSASYYCMCRVRWPLTGQEDPLPLWGVGEQGVPMQVEVILQPGKVMCPVGHPCISLQLLEVFPWVWSPSSLGRLLCDSSPDGTESALGRREGCRAAARTPLWGKPRKVLLPVPPRWPLLAAPWLGKLCLSQSTLLAALRGKSNSWFLVFSYFLTALSEILFNYNVHRDEQGKMEFNTSVQSKWSKELSKFSIL